MVKLRKQLYKTSRWRKVRQLVIARQGGICNRCDKPIEEIHHIIALTEENFTDPIIAYSLENLEGLCHDCHNQETNPSVSVRDDIGFDKDGNVVKKMTKNEAKNVNF
jgi:5-methylcytosine-specific restriction endonuclease McrA